MSVYQTITDKIVQAIEAGADGSGFKMPWHHAGGRPVNVATEKLYRGMNTVSLWCEGQAQGYASTQWGTFKQWQSQGAKVRKGEKGTIVVFWKNLPKKDAEDKVRFVLKTSYAFNEEQVEGYHPPLAAVQEAPDRIPEAERYVAAIPSLDLRFGGDRAFYNTVQDFVQLPKLEHFYSAHGYYSTLLHECAHWTGHKKRLERDFSCRFGSEAYAFEELVAELSAAFLCGDLGLSNEPRHDHAEYIAGWLRVLNSDPRAIFKASSEAAKAADFLSKYSSKESAEKVIRNC